MTDRALGTFFLVFSVLYIYFASKTELSFISDPLGPKKFPYLIGFIMFVSSIFIIVKPEIKPKWSSLYKFIELFILVIVLILYAQFLPILGFTISSAIATSFISWRLGSKVIESIIFGVVFSLLLYFLFHIVLGLSLAKGFFGF